MNVIEKEKIHEFRTAGISYQRISEILDLPIGTIKSYCSRNKIKPNTSVEKDTCKNCGKKLHQIPKQKTRKFCSDACRMEWWRNNRSLRKSNGEKRICCRCGKSYESYNPDSKYCSHSCYISERFGKSGVRLG